MSAVEGFISIPELAKLLRCSPATVMRCVAKEVPVYRPTVKKRLFRLEDVERWLETKCARVEADPIVKKLLQQVTA